MDAAMPRTPKPPSDDPEQSKRFSEIAHEMDASGTQEEFDKAFRKIASRAPRALKKRARVRAGAFEPQETKRRS